MTYKPHPPANPEWPDYLKRMYVEGCKKIDRLRKQVTDDGICCLPFECYICEEMRDDYCKLNGDGCPMCIKCLGGLEFVLQMALEDK